MARVWLPTLLEECVEAQRKYKNATKEWILLGDLFEEAAYGVSDHTVDQAQEERDKAEKRFEEACKALLEAISEEAERRENQPTPVAS